MHSEIHFPKNMQELLTARKRLVFDEFLLFVLAIQLLKEKTEEAPNTFPMKPVWTTEEIIEGLPYDLTGSHNWHLRADSVPVSPPADIPHGEAPNT